MSLSLAAQRKADNYAGLDLQQLIDIQAVNVNDYRLARDAGNLDDAAAIYRHEVEPLGEYIDSIDGTRR